MPEDLLDLGPQRERSKFAFEGSPLVQPKLERRSAVGWARM